MKTYEINGVIIFAQVICREVQANSKKEARTIAKSQIGHRADSTLTELDTFTIDEPIEIED